MSALALIVLPTSSAKSEVAMRWVHSTIVVLFGAATLIFLVQNREIVSMDFLGFSVRAPLAVIAAIFYVLGAITGGSAYALLRRSVRAASAKANVPPQSA